MMLFLPPAPHSGEFFDSIRAALSDLDTKAATYPGYGDRPKTEVSIEAYATSLLPQTDGTTLVGFHTGCLVAIDMALQANNLGSLILIDIPFFDEAARKKHAAGLDPDNDKHDAFRAAFDYDTEQALSRLSHSVICVATQSSLYAATEMAAAKIDGSQFIPRSDITKPAFENEGMAKLLREWGA